MSIAFTFDHPIGIMCGKIYKSWSWAWRRIIVRCIKDILLCLPVPPNVKESVKCSFSGQTNTDVLAARMESVRVIVNIPPQNSSAIRERHMMATYSTHTKTKVQQNSIYHPLQCGLFVHLFATRKPLSQFCLKKPQKHGVWVMRFGVIYNCHFF